MSENTQKIGPGKFVAYSYRLYNDADNKLLFEAPEDAPDVMVFGASHEIIPGLIETLKGLSKGDRFGVTLPPQLAFGERNPEYVMTLEKGIFERDGKLADEVKVGAMLPMITQEGFRVQGLVAEIGDKNVTMDFNHPFAGMTVRYEGKIKEVRDATPEEIQPSHSCGCGSCGSCGDGSCGNGCGDEGSSCGCSGGCH